jgi:hypothetical protein
MKYIVTDEDIVCLHNARCYIAKALLDGKGEISELTRQHLVEALCYLSPTTIRLRNEQTEQEKERLKKNSRTLSSNNL